MNCPRLIQLGLLALLSACTGDHPHEIPGLPVGEWVVHPLSTDARFVFVRDMTLMGEHLWVLDGAPPFLTRISLTTGVAIRLGKRGEGPGEFLAPWAIQPTLDSTGVLIWDFGAQRVTEYDLSGTLVGSETMSQEGRIRVRSNFREVSYADPFRVRSTPVGYLAGIFEGRLDLTTDYSRGSIRLSGSALNPGQNLIRMTDLVIPGVESMKEWAAVPFWDACGHDLVVGKPSSGSVLWVSLDGVAHQEVTLSLPSLKIEREDIQRYLKRMARLELGPGYQDEGLDFARMAERARERFAEVRPFITDLRCQDGGTAWLRLFCTEHDPLGRSTWWVQIGPDGPIRQVNSPTGFSPFLFRDEGHLGSYELPGGEQAIALASPPSDQLSDPH